MNIKLTAGAVALAAIGAVSLTGLAAGRDNRGPGGPPDPARMVAHMAEDLDLTADQVTEITAVMTDEQTKTADYRAKLGDLDTQMRAATANGHFDEAAVRSIAAQQAAIFTELTVERERGRSQIYNTLTTEQRTKFESMRPQGPPPGGFGKFGFPPPPPPQN